jgi:hypothetical protein
MWVLMCAFLNLAAVMAAGPDQERKASTIDLLSDHSPFANDVLSSLLSDAIAKGENNRQPRKDWLLPVLLIIERATCPLVLGDQDLGYRGIILPQLHAMLQFAFDIEIKGAVLRAMAAFASHHETAREMWETLEALRMLGPRDPATGQRPKAGLYKELLDNEALQKLYPLSEGFAT